MRNFLLIVTLGFLFSCNDKTLPNNCSVGYFEDFPGCCCTIFLEDGRILSYNNLILLHVEKGEMQKYCIEFEEIEVNIGSTECDEIIPINLISANKL